MKTVIIRSFYFLAACLLLSGCEKQLGEGVTLKDIAQGETTSARLLLGESIRFYAYPLPYDCTDYEFKWESSDPGVAKVDDFGRVTTVNLGTTTISVSQGNIKKDFSLEVYELPILEQMTGYWTFEDDGNLGKATTGANLELSGAGFSSIEGPKADNKAVRVEKGSYFKCAHGSGSTTAYTIMMDFKLPAATRACFVQTKLENNDDVDFFLRGNMYEIGVVGAYTDLRQTSINQIEANTWYRMFIVIQLDGTSTYYINGVNVGEAKLAAGNRMQLDKTHVLLFADEDGEDETIDVAAVAFWGRALEKRHIDSIPAF
ncbi:MAG: Ig-like domain-containing protein [Tannerella sp.]|jgi:hypothetical protein|nr:Ig-like domain-containing protein [Tannerella sp.]